MARKLKVYRTTAGGFFELAVAAPSMKAAAEAWGADPDVFKRGFAEETDDPKAVEAAMAAPGTVLRRPVGSDAHSRSTPRCRRRRRVRGSHRRIARRLPAPPGNPARRPRRSRWLTSKRS